MANFRLVNLRFSLPADFCSRQRQRQRQLLRQVNLTFDDFLTSDHDETWWRRSTNLHEPDEVLQSGLKALGHAQDLGVWERT